MRVNSAFTSFLPTPVTVRYSTVIVLLAIFIAVSSFRSPIDRDLLSKEVNISIREIGHRLLLQAGDSTSRVMPITEIKEGTFRLEFENEFIFNHDSIQLLSKTLLPETKFPSGYTLTVHDCTKRNIVYGFQVNNTSPNVLPCGHRSQPKGCYILEFVFPDLYKNTAEQKAEVDHRTIASTPAKANRQGAVQQSVELKPKTADNSIQERSKKLKAIEVDNSEDDAKHAGSETAFLTDSLGYVMYAGILVLVVTVFLIWRFGKNVKAAPVQDQNDANLQTAAPEFPLLGKFQFFEKGQRLLLGSEVISLTDKECKVLSLLHKNFGELIPRDTLMQEVWISEGVITGRSLDMFVSKLRKKLSRDPDLRITNVHGKGYKLELAEKENI